MEPTTIPADLVEAQMKKLGASRPTMRILEQKVQLVKSETAVGASALNSMLDDAYVCSESQESRHGHTRNSERSQSEYFTFYKEKGYDIAGSELDAESAMRILSILRLSEEDTFIDLGSASGR